MDPVTLGVGALAVGSLVQLYNSEKARGAEASRLKQIQDTYNKIKPPNYNLKITDPPELHTETLASPQFAGEVNAPKYNLDKLTPQEFSVIGQYNPQIAPYIAEKNPELLKQTQDMQSGRAAQMAALQKFQQVGAGEFDPQYQQAVTQASRQAQTEAQSRQASILQDYARRGQANSGAELAAQIGGTAQSMDRNAMANLSAASQSYQNRLNALSQGAQLGSQISQQDLNMQKNNNDTINAFNQRMSSQRQQYETQKASALNQAQVQNLQNAQSTANRNTDQANQNNVAYQNRLDQIAKSNAGFQQQERNTANQNAIFNYNSSVNQRNYQNQMAQQQYQNSVNQNKYQNDLLNQQYNNQLGKAQIGAGVSGQIGAQQIQSAQDRNAAIGGLAQTAAIYGQGQQQQQNQSDNAMRQADLASYQRTGNFMNDDQMQQYKDRYNNNDYY